MLFSAPRLPISFKKFLLAAARKACTFLSFSRLSFWRSTDMGRSMERDGMRLFTRPVFTTHDVYTHIKYYGIFNENMLLLKILMYTYNLSILIRSFRFYYLLICLLNLVFPTIIVILLPVLCKWSSLICSYLASNVNV